MEFFDVFLNKETIHTLTLNQKMFFSLVVTLLGMGITFLGLMAIQLMTMISSYVVRSIEEKADNTVTIDQSPVVQSTTENLISQSNGAGNDEINEELIAVITAAIAASLQTRTSNIVVKNIRRVEHTTPVWATAGRSEQLSSRF